MARQTYGKTPWGAEWIAAMERIDHNTNRLPRGRTYANRGSVLSVEIRDGGVLAKVQGSRSTPYRIEIRLAPLSEKAVSGLLQVIESMPSVAIQLSLGRMPGELLEALKKKGINPYPKSWNDIQANCSCPDWANPCKHLAAVYYILANEIDKNPFLLFELGGVKKSLLVREIAGNSELAALPMESFIPFADAPPREIPNEIDVPALNFPSGDGARLFTLLPQESLFYAQGDFRRVLFSIQETAGRAADNVEVSDEKIENLSETAFHLVYSGKDPVLFAYPAPSFLDGEVASHAVPPETSGGRWKRVEGRQWPLEEGLRFFL
ncbi:MAG: hypothetical protein HKL98_08195, partial [Burkholderiales bacterium]|nr:hypothetical protein [Burkholderiales bacterium]